MNSNIQLAELVDKAKQNSVSFIKYPKYYPSYVVRYDICL